MMARRVLIIGSGCSGLTATKAVLEEGMQPVCVERTSIIGGLWHFIEQGKGDGQATVMRSTIINTSKEVMSFSDFPIPKEYANYMHNTKVMEYFNQYVDHFDLRRHICFNTEVKKISKAKDFVASGKWSVDLLDRKSGKERTEIFDAVMLCTGHHANKKMPTFPGQENFEGKIFHTQDYKDQRGCEGSRCVVVGMGNSGMDLISELSRCSSIVYMANRRGGWIMSKKGRQGVPPDLGLHNRFAAFVANLFPRKMLSNMIEKDINDNFDHELYGLKPKHDFLSAHPSSSDDLPIRILSGVVVVKPNIKQFTKTGVIFEDGTKADNIDQVFMATGYVFGFPFVDKDVIDVKDNNIELYKYMFPPDLEHPTLAVIGCVQPLGSTIPMAELQSRWAARVFKGENMLPSREAMWEDIHHKQEMMAKRYVGSTRHTIQVDWVPFMDELAEQIGCKPNIGRLLRTDPRLAKEVIFGVVTPSQYRLTGPHPWSGAREHILNTMDRVYYPFAGRPMDKSSSISPLLYLCAVIALVLAWFFFLC